MRFFLDKIVLAGAICALAAPVFADDMSTNMPSTMVTPADFAWDASLINLKEIRLGEAAQQNSQNPEVKNFGEHMVRDHTKMNEKLARIAEAESLMLPPTNTFYIEVSQPPAEKPATELMMGNPNERLLAAQLDVQHLVSLTGSDFDQAYADAMVKGHEKAIQKFEDASSTLQDKQLKKYADRGLRAIRGHYEMAQKLQTDLMQNTNAPGSTPNM
jgi:putative membrane protein